MSIILRLQDSAMFDQSNSSFLKRCGASRTRAATSCVTSRAIATPVPSDAPIKRFAIGGFTTVQQAACVGGPVEPP